MSNYSNAIILKSFLYNLLVFYVYFVKNKHVIL